MKTEITIQGRKIGKNHKPFIVAELSCNHQGSLSTALALVDAAKKANVDAVKLQTFTPDTMTINCHRKEFLIENTNNLWNGKYLYDLYQQAYTPWEWHQKLFEYCKSLGLICFSTPYDYSAIDFLEKLDVPCYKVASFENIDIPLIRQIAATGKPIILSTGMASLREIEESIDAARTYGCKQMMLLKCTSAYPAPPSEINLITLKHMRQYFKLPVGLSDHTLGIGVAIASVALGASLIEKHFVLDRASDSLDAAFSMEPSEMQLLVQETERAWLAIGNTSYEQTSSDKYSALYRRSLFICKDIDKGERLTPDHVKCIRPGYGLPPKFYDQIIGKKVTKKLDCGTPIQWEFLSMEG